MHAQLSCVAMWTLLVSCIIYCAAFSLATAPAAVCVHGSPDGSGGCVCRDGEKESACVWVLRLYRPVCTCVGVHTSLTGWTLVDCSAPVYAIPSAPFATLPLWPYTADSYSDNHPLFPANDILDVFFFTSVQSVRGDSFNKTTLWMRSNTLNVTLSDCGIRTKGQTGAIDSYHVKFSAPLFGLRGMGFKSSAAVDLSLMRERLAMRVMRSMGVPVMREGFACVHINGTLQGLYTTQELIDEQVSEGRLHLILDRVTLSGSLYRFLLSHTFW